MPRNGREPVLKVLATGVLQQVVYQRSAPFEVTLVHLSLSNPLAISRYRGDTCTEAVPPCSSRISSA